VLDRFPCALYFTVDGDQVTVIACFTPAVIHAIGRSARNALLDSDLSFSAQPTRLGAYVWQRA
jgi:hypothetical protein